jgi:hypothetical protein
MGTRKITVGIPQLTWLYVDVEVEDEGEPEMEREQAIEAAYEEAKRHDLCANCQAPYRGNWRRAVDDLGTLVGTQVTLELDVTMH